MGMNPIERKAFFTENTAALRAGQFIAYFQPQYNHSTGMLIGAEALSRRAHPDKGILSPAFFISGFEETGLITELDLSIFESVCRFQKTVIEQGCSTVPISINISSVDIYSPNFIDRLEAIRCRYDVPTSYLRLELTESAVAGDSETASAFISGLHGLGYKIAMDDFGSGYSSLNVLKDMDFDIIKLDMMFLRGNLYSGRGGTILSSVVRMCRLLGLPGIAEGVEDIQQAEFLKSIGCDNIQGYLYSPPITEEAFLDVLKKGGHSDISPMLSLIQSMDAGAFWSPESMETLIFNNYVGAAAIFEYDGEKVEILRVNDKYLQELGMNHSTRDIVYSDAFSPLDEEGLKIFRNMLELAKETGTEQECETWRNVHSKCCGIENICIRSTVRLIGKSPLSCLFYATIRNITAEKNCLTILNDTDRRFRAASEQANIYFWEYDIATKEMHPCFRCMRDLGMPAVVVNYPEPAIEMGIFPPEYADMYRDWHRQISEGVEHLEAIIPLTSGRVPFHVRYTTEFDEFGRPVKAYGSATLVVDQ